ncbi:MAG: hypothetical protein NTV51_13265, partial [Verrucomicrobia bacterium]|nr:hypothetical protein [Verrucomicrobiota bacterium]
MPGLKDILRRQLAQRGYVVTKLEPGPAPSLGACLQSLHARAPAPASVLCLDQEIRVQSELLATFPAEQVVFASPILDDAGQPAPGTTLPGEPSGPFVAVIDIALFPLVPLWAKLPWLAKAAVLLRRPRGGAVWAGERALAPRAAARAARGGPRADALDCTGGPPRPAP